MGPAVGESGLASANYVPVRPHTDPQNSSSTDCVYKGNTTQIGYRHVGMGVSWHAAVARERTREFTETLRLTTTDTHPRGANKESIEERSRRSNKRGT
jgi:hypothetical protein